MRTLVKYRYMFAAGIVVLAVPLFLLAEKFPQLALAWNDSQDHPQRKEKKIVQLPAPKQDGRLSVEKSIAQRRSVRDYTEKKLTLEQIAQLLWSAQGITNRQGLRAAPSAGALYPLELAVVAGRVTDLEPGGYRYIPEKHQLALLRQGDVRRQMAQAAYGQEWLAEAPAIIVLAGVYERTTGKYGDRGIRYVHMEVGFAGENLFLQAEALGLNSAVVGAFSDKKVHEILSLEKKERPLSLMPVGYERQ